MEQIPYMTILRAKQGNEDALQIIMKKYSGKIESVWTRTQKCKDGRENKQVDTAIQKRIENELMLQIVYGYDINQGKPYRWDKQ